MQEDKRWYKAPCEKDAKTIDNYGACVKQVFESDAAGSLTAFEEAFKLSKHTHVFIALGFRYCTDALQAMKEFAESEKANLKFQARHYLRLYESDAVQLRSKHNGMRQILNVIRTGRPFKAKKQQERKEPAALTKNEIAYLKTFLNHKPGGIAWLFVVPYTAEDGSWQVLVHYRTVRIVQVDETMTGEKLMQKATPKVTPKQDDLKDLGKRVEMSLSALAKCPREVHGRVMGKILDEIKSECRHCHAQGKKFLVCSGCKLSRFCDAKCRDACTTHAELCGTEHAFFAALMTGL